MKIFIYVCIAIVAAWIATLAGTHYFFHDWQTQGQFGDLFGSLNALVSGFAFAALIATLLLQRQELSLQREELKLQREEMKKSRQELAKQAMQQRNQSMATLTELKLRCLEAEISEIEDRLLDRHLPAFVDEMSLDDAREYLASYGTLHMCVRLSLILNSQKKQGLDDWSGVPAGVKSSEIALKNARKLSLRASRWAARSSLVADLSPWFLEMADQMVVEA